MTIWLTKLLLSHLLTDFVLQGKKWVDHKRTHHFRSWYLYLHTFITASVAWILIGWEYWQIALIIFVTHTLIDGWKSYQREESVFFFVDQLLHLLVIFLCWWFTFYNFSDLEYNWEKITEDTSLWVLITAFVFLSWPAAVLISQATTKWRSNLNNSEALSNAGKWIGMIERAMILILVLQNQYEAIGLLIAAKGIIRFNEANRPEQKTEYLLIGTLISISLAMVTGLIVFELT